MRLIKVAYEERNHLNFNRVWSIYSLSDQERAWFDEFKARKQFILSMNPKREGIEKLQEALPVLELFISGFLGSQGFKRYVATAWGGIEDGATGHVSLITDLQTITAEENFKEKQIILQPNFHIQQKDGSLEIWSYLNVMDTDKDSRAYFDILQEIYKKHYLKQEGVVNPLVRICGLGAEFGGAGLTRRVIENFAEICKKLTLDDIEELKILKREISKRRRSEGRYNKDYMDKKESIVLETLVREYENRLANIQTI